MSITLVAILGLLAGLAVGLVIAVLSRRRGHDNDRNHP
jgi:uncharacterized membrane-anchored protein YhcB (DUF1043 family)